MKSSSINVRAVTEDDVPALEAIGLSRAVSSFENPLFVVEEHDIVLGFGFIDPQGPPSDPGCPLARATFARSARPEHREQLIAGLIDHARELGLPRLLAGCDPMNRQEVGVLESLGFRSTGRGPYFPLGPRSVQYVTGYQDATGSTLDFAIDL